MSNNQVFNFDFTIDANDLTKETMINLLTDKCKKWVFQLEKGESSDYLHYQGRISLKTKDRPESLAKKFKEILGNRSIRITRTSITNKDNTFYVTKEDTRVDGPWKDEDDTPVYIPRQLRELYENKEFKWRPFQQKILDDFKIWNTRTINLLFDPQGNKGKSIIKTHASVHKIAMTLPMINDYKDIMRMTMDMPKVGGYIIDMPKAIKKDKLGQIYSAIEHIKDGYAFDDRYNFKYEHFDCPNIWVFTNRLPELEMLSKDRWKIWYVDENYDLKEVTYKSPDTPGEIRPTYSSLAIINKC